LAAALRNRLYDRGWKRVHRADAPVISVGNITAGGTGKTPLVAWLARLLVIRKMRPAILSRGYGRDPGRGIDDENAVLARLAGGVPVVVDADRVRGAATAVRQHGADVLVLDDGFQHRRLARDLDIVLLDALWPFGAGHMLPRGLLREPLRGLSRAGFLLTTRCDLVTADRLEAIQARLHELAPGVPQACCRTVVHELRPLVGEEGNAPPEAMGEGRWLAFCGIGNPEGFRLTLEHAGCKPLALRVFADHERYTEAQVASLLDEAHVAGCAGLLTTEKDAVKVAPLLAGGPAVPVYAVHTDLDFAAGSEALTAAILDAIGRSA
jgi:tetraacyldisaccharide 4'-kinase